MEDGSNGPSSDVEVADHTKNGVVAPIMANFPEGTVAVTKEDNVESSELNKVNGDTNLDETFTEEYGSESDALVIDESIPKVKKLNKKKKTLKLNNKSVNETNSVDEGEVVTHSNPFFNESLYELSQQHQIAEVDTSVTVDNQNNKSKTIVESKSEANCKVHKHKRTKSKSKPKLQEYAQYLGLQPTVQFKCSKCGTAGFESLSILNEHIVQCNAIPSEHQQPTQNSSSSFKLTRKVFLCSACGTYYENWNLYMHMLEFHRRYICLYCLGMFSVLEDLCQHIQSRHNLEPGYKNSPDEFFNVYNEPCYVVCCECNKLFSEQDNFFYHDCIRSDLLNITKNNQKNRTKLVKQQIRPENHITGDSLSVAEEVKCSDSSESNGNTKIVNVNLEGVETLEHSEPVGDKQNTELIATETEEKSTTDMTVDMNESQICPEVKSETPEEVSKDNSEEILSENCEESRDSIFSNYSDSTKPPEEIKPSYPVDTANETLETSGNTAIEEEKEEIEQEQEMEEELPENVEPVETRKVPKLSLKLPKAGTYHESEAEDSDDSDKMAMETEQIESENENETQNEALNINEEVDENVQASSSEQQLLQVAGTDISIVELELEQPLDKFDIRVLLQKCLRATSSTCIYCNHARKIAVNGKQLGLHAIAEHRYSAVVNSITAEELIPESFVSRIKESFSELEDIFFNLESSASDEGVTFSHLFECFQCRYSTSIHKELYLHNRKLHAKNLLLCIMCKSNFYSYSELICHLCPGLYILDYDVQFRCCMCVSDDLPSAFRLMVHLRKRHHVCDVCLEMCNNQYRLSNHVWKHKLHHFCYRCGIAYRNKQDITRHLFWKHGTESVLCKRCLQKKWPHVFHFCVPPASFLCEDCNLTFSKAVALKVHKRIHAEEKPHACTFEDCTEKFISKKLLLKHENRHKEPPEEPPKEEAKEIEVHKEVVNVAENQDNMEENKEEKPEEKPKPKIDLYDLPALNLSESDSSDSEDEAQKSKEPEGSYTEDSKSLGEANEEKGFVPLNGNTAADTVKDTVLQVEDVDKPTPVLDNIWDDFKNYQASKEKRENLFSDADKDEPACEIPILTEVKELTPEDALRDHDYCIDSERKADTSLIEVKPDLLMAQRVDHDYCSSKLEAAPPSPVNEEKVEDKTPKSPKKPTNSSSSNSSSDSDSSSCSCGSNCSCSSSSGSSSSSSDSSDSDSSSEEGRKRQQLRREKRREKAKAKKGATTENKVVDVVAMENQPPLVPETPIQESDLDTTESETDEEFYDRQPQKLAKKILEEKRNQLLAEIGPVANGTFIESTSRQPTPTPSMMEEEVKPKKKSKSKKRKKRKSERKEQEARQAYQTPAVPVTYYQYQQQPPTVAPITLTLSRNSPVPSPSASVAPSSMYPKVSTEPSFARQDSMDSNLRASKRRRVPNKFYGYSSDEEQEKGPAPAQKWRKTEVTSAPHSPMTVPPITIKTGPPPVQHHQPPPVEPFSIRPSAHPGEMRIHRPLPPISFRMPRPPVVQPPTDRDSNTDSNDSDSEDQTVAAPVPPKPNQPQLYCYCRCPYDEVSEMIGCDASDCAIEWFHFECVGIMVPPKGQWFCPDCRKKKQQRREMLQS